MKFKLIIMVWVSLITFILCKKEELSPFFALYHIAHHSGTAIWQLSRRSGLWSDGMNGIYDIGCEEAQHLSKAELMSLWRTNVSTDSLARSIRHPELNPAVRILPHQREFIQFENPLCDAVWDLLPMGKKGAEASFHTFTVIMNPIIRASKGDGARPRTESNIGWFGRIENFSVRLFSGEVNNVLRHERIHHKPTLTPASLAKAKERLAAFDHIIIAEAMTETSRFLCDEWHWEHCALAHSNNIHGMHPREMIADDEAYSYFLDVNGPELELYDFAVSLAKRQLKEAGKASPKLDAFPTDSREVLRKCAVEAITDNMVQQQECRRLIGVAYS